MAGQPCGMQSGLNRAYAMGSIAMVAVIIYGSLYPFEFSVPIAGPGPIKTLLGTWAEKPGRGDFIANILLYAPLGFFANLAVLHERRLLLRFLSVFFLGAILSVCMELTQYYVPSRVTSALDVYANALGTGIGAVVANLTAGNLRWSFLAPLRAHRIPTLLLIAWLGYRLFPFVPTIGLHKYWSALKPLFLAPALSTYALFRQSAVWLTVYALVATVGETTRPFLLLPLFAAAVLAAQVLVIGGALSLPHVLGAGVAYVLWAALGWSGRVYRALNMLLLGFAIVALRIEPFHVTAHSAPFGWVPFHSFLQGSINVNVLSFFEKFFLYGSWIWLLTGIGLSYARAGCLIVAPTLLATSFLETHLPNRSAKITDAVMAISISVLFALIARADAPSSTAAPPRFRSNVVGIASEPPG